MNRLYLLLAALFVMASCSKDESINSCDANMQRHFSEQLRCVSATQHYTDLHRGEYQGRTVYFLGTMCIYCSVPQLEYVYTCDLEEVRLSARSELKNVKQVYSSCSRKFIP